MQWQQGEGERDKGERSKVQKISFAEDRFQRERAEMLMLQSIKLVVMLEVF